MDRTNWKFGKTNINILTIGISWRGTNTLIFILAIAFIWALKTGEMLLEYGHQIPIKQFKKWKG